MFEYKLKSCCFFIFLWLRLELKIKIKQLYSFKMLTSVLLRLNFAFESNFSSWRKRKTINAVRIRFRLSSSGVVFATFNNINLKRWTDSQSSFFDRFMFSQLNKTNGLALVLPVVVSPVVLSLSLPWCLGGVPWWC